jgi:UPF0755 protein
LGDTSQQVENVKKFGTRRNIILGLILLVCLLIIGAGVGSYTYISSNLASINNDPTASPVSISIPKGASASRIGEILAQAKLIKDPRFFSLYTRYKNYSSSFQSGEYSINPNQDLQSIMNTLKKGPESTAVRVTIPEGLTTKQIVDLLVQEKLIDKEKFISLVKSKDFGFSFLQGLPQSEARLEGFLFPDTYEIEPGTSEEAIISLMLKRFEQELTPEVKAAISQKGSTVQNFVTLASLIEREAREAEDRPVISQVFLKRLKIGMPLQSCASIQFILGTAKPVLSLKDLEVKSPYNTYKNIGLPPGPIANPGRAALLAAAFPASTDYLYFVARPDGYHAFAKSYEEHLRNVKKYEQ